MAGEIWGQTRNSGDRTIGPGDLTKRRSGGPSRLWCTDMGTDTMSGIKSRPDGLSRVWHPDMGTDTRFGRPDFWPGGRDQEPAGRFKPAGRPHMGTDTVSGVPIRNV